MASESYRDGYHDGKQGLPVNTCHCGVCAIEYAEGYQNGESDRLLLAQNAQKEPSANPESVWPYDSGYADGLAGIEPFTIHYSGNYIPDSYVHGYHDGQKARERHAVPESSDSRSTGDSDGNTEESSPSILYAVLMLWTDGGSTLDSVHKTEESADNRTRELLRNPEYKNELEAIAVQQTPYFS